MYSRTSHSRTRGIRWAGLGLATILSVLYGCNGDDGAQGPPGQTPDQPPPQIEKRLNEGDPLPGFNLSITDVSGGSAPDGRFQPGDTPSVTFTLRFDDGSTIPISQIDSAGILASGPTYNYQPIVTMQRDVIGRAVQNADGSYSYTFASPIPATYLPPLNDTTSFGAVDGEMQGQPLVHGTYTVGMEGYINYDIAGKSVRDAGNATRDFLVGTTTDLEPRQVVTTANCNQCHASLRAHGTIRRDVNHCLLCHTAGAEDGNDPAAAGGTPGVSIDFRVMIHKIHSGAHLPSVLGVATKENGSRDYGATPQPYKIQGRRSSIHDFSHVGFPVWPNLSDPLPRDVGYGDLTPAQQSLENQMRSGVASCAKCHGDPDGSGPLEAPRQGHLAYSNPTRVACGSCHDDIDWARPYRANELLMPPQPDNSACVLCHEASGSLLAVEDAHRHPLLDPKRNKGLVFTIADLRESGNHNNNGKLDPGEKVQVDLTIKDASGAEVVPSELDRMEVVVNGPTTNRNILLEERFPVAVLKSANPTTYLPERVFLEYLGRANSERGTYDSSRPHWDAAGAETTLWVTRNPRSSAGSILTAAIAPHQNHLDVVEASPFARGNYIVVAEGEATEEYLRIQWVDGNRLWFSSTHGPYDQPGMRYAHPAGATVGPVDLERKTRDTDYKLDPANGRITEMIPFGDGKAVIVSYTRDFEIPATYPSALNASPDLGQEWGAWTGLAIAPGTYTVSIWGERSVKVTVGEDTVTTYAAPSHAGTRHFLVGSASKIETPKVISSAGNCYACHNDLRFHGGHRSGFETCIACHGTAGSEDRPRYVAPNAPPTTGVSIDFRRMLHKIHTGKDLANPSTYVVVGFGSGYPNNYTAHSYAQVGFPSMPGGTLACATCHGANNTAWVKPTARNHPDQITDTRVWMVACGSCHDSTAAQAHIDVQTSRHGQESCAVCHGQGREWEVNLKHIAR